VTGNDGRPGALEYGYENRGGGNQAGHSSNYRWPCCWRRRKIFSFVEEGGGEVSGAKNENEIGKTAPGGSVRYKVCSIALRFDPWAKEGWQALPHPRKEKSG